MADERNESLDSGPHHVEDSRVARVLSSPGSRRDARPGSPPPPDLGSEADNQYRRLKERWAALVARKNELQVEMSRLNTQVRGHRLPHDQYTAVLRRQAEVNEAMHSNEAAMTDLKPRMVAAAREASPGGPDLLARLLAEHQKTNALLAQLVRAVNDLSRSD